MPKVNEDTGTNLRSLCETCCSMREIVTLKGSRFLFCQLSKTDEAFPKYPAQPKIRCDGYQPDDKPADAS